MNTRKLWCMVAIAVLVAAAAAPAKADRVVVYDNGPLNGNVQAYGVSLGLSVSDSFQVQPDGFTMVTGATVGLWVLLGDKPLTVDWSIGTSFFGSDVASGTSILTNKPDFTNSFGYRVFTSSFSFGNSGFGPGAYYLTLQNATSVEGNAVYWDQNKGRRRPWTARLARSPRRHSRSSAKASPTRPSRLRCFYLAPACWASREESGRASKSKEKRDEHAKALVDGGDCGPCGRGVGRTGQGGPGAV